jgi:CubicO group peptidase (beta-lactamase class C family)
VSCAVALWGSSAFGDRGEVNHSASVDKLFEKWDRPDAPGFAVGVILNGKFVHKRGYGMANLDADIPIMSKTSFDVMSLAKSFTTACAARLFDQGVLSPDSDVRRYVPELPEYDPPVTIRHLVTCRSGLRDFYYLMILLGRSEQDAYTKTDVLDVISRQKTPMFKPGTRFAYSNSDYFLLALVIERATGKSFREVTSEQLFDPLEMKHSFFDDDEALPRKHRAIGHSRIGDGPWRRYGLNSSTVGPWRLMTTLDDMLLWDASFTNDVLPAGKHLVAFHKTGSLFNNEKCLSGFPRKTHKGLNRVWYTGGGLGFHAHFIRFPDHGLSIVAFCNLSTAQAWDDMARTLPMVADLYLSDEVDATEPEEPWLPQGAADAALTDKEMEEIGGRVIGTYRSQYGYFVRVSRRDGRLQFQWLFFDYALQAPEPLVVVALNRLRTSRGYNEFELVFEGDARERSEIRVKYRDGRKERWKPVEFVTLDAEQMANYEGDYYSTDLESVYRISAVDGKLFVQFNHGRKRWLLPTVADTFKTMNERFSGMVFTFSQDESGDIAGFGVDFDRVSDLRFERRSP